MTWLNILILVDYLKRKRLRNFYNTHIRKLFRKFHKEIIICDHYNKQRDNINRAYFC